MNQIGWRLLQTAIFIGGTVWVGWLDSGPGGSKSAAPIIGGFLIVLAFTTIVSGLQNWLIRRRARRLAASVGLSDEPDHRGYSPRRAGPMHF